MTVIKQLEIAPSVLSADFSQLGEQIASVARAGGQVLHLDIMDGHYVPNLTFGPMVVKALRKMTGMELEAHLMISDPDTYLDEFIAAGANVVLVHPSTCSAVLETLARIKSLGAKAGLVVNPDEKLSMVRPYLKQMDQLLIMSVFPGFGGQAFIPGVLDELPELLDQFAENKVLIEIDGGINHETIPTIRGLGIDRFVAGSAVFNHTADPGENYQNLLTRLIQV